MLVALFAVSRKKGGVCAAHKGLETMLSGIFKPCEVKISLCSKGSPRAFLSRPEGKGQCPDMGFVKCKAQRGVEV